MNTTARIGAPTTAAGRVTRVHTGWGFAGAAPLSNPEASLTLRLLPLDVYRLDPSVGRTGVGPVDHPLDRIGIAFEYCLDTAVGQIAHPTVYSLCRSQALRLLPEEYALDPARDEYVRPFDRCV